MLKIPIWEVSFWVCVIAITYHYIGYPFLVFVLALFSQAKSDLLYLTGRKNRRSSGEINHVPHVSILISAYNEEAVIRARVKNLLEINYPPECLEVLIGLDAPTDSTVKFLAEIESNRLNVVQFRHRRGKLAVLCDLAQRTSAELLVFTDANTMMESNCIRNLARHFADPRVGAVSGEEIRLVAPGTDPGAEALYWRYESAVKILESRLNCSLGGNGGVLALRCSLFHPKKQSIVEDFQIPMEIRFKGHRVVYDPEAVAVEEIAPTFSTQFARRVRISAGNYQTLFGSPEYLNPLKGFLAFAYFSHRVLRWLVPIFLTIALGSSAAMVLQPKFAVFAGVQCSFYLAAMLGYWFKKRGKKPGPLLSLPLYFCSMNLALILGLFAYLSGQQGLTWKSTPRNVQTETLADSR